VTSLISDGIVAGVGGILTFLPNIFILFLALAFLEDSGYMSRVAYIMDGIMGKLGLSGKSFIPMILGFGCTVPAVMASRALATKKDRFRTMLVTPFFSCSAKIPIYVLFAGMFFPQNPALVAFSLYVIGFAMGIFIAWISHLMDKDKNENELLIELPEYKRPSSHTIFIYVWTKVKDYLQRAGTIIFISSIVMWFILNFGPAGYVGSGTAVSFGSIVGQAIVPVFTPIGLGYWQIVVALIAGISAKEVVVSSCAVLFGISNINSAGGMSAMVSVLSGMGFGPLNAYCLMLFCLLYVPCIASMATIRRESGSAKYTAFVAVFQIAVAYLMSLLVFQIGSLF
jgi:ferrous iron transport protein B